MSCICKQRIGTLSCLDCGANTQIDYEKGQDPLVVAKEKNKVCRKCKGSNLEIKK